MTSSTDSYTLSLHDALPISARAARAGADHGDRERGPRHGRHVPDPAAARGHPALPARGPAAQDAALPRHPAGPIGLLPRDDPARSEEHTSELQSRQYLV